MEEGDGRKGSGGGGEEGVREEVGGGEGVEEGVREEVGGGEKEKIWNVHSTNFVDISIAICTDFMRLSLIW